MADDPTGGLAHTMDPPLALRLPRQPRKSATIALRWRVRWEPECVLISKRDGEADPATYFSILKERFRRRVRRLLAAGLDWRTILNSDYDSPLATGTEFDRKLCLAIERRRCRMNRVKGKGKKYAHRSRSRNQ